MWESLTSIFFASNVVRSPCLPPITFSFAVCCEYCLSLNLSLLLFSAYDELRPNAIRKCRPKLRLVSIHGSLILLPFIIFVASWSISLIQTFHSQVSHFLSICFEGQLSFSLPDDGRSVDTYSHPMYLVLSSNKKCHAFSLFNPMFSSFSPSACLSDITR